MRSQEQQSKSKPLYLLLAWEIERDGAPGESGVYILWAPINKGIFSYLNLIISFKSDYQIKIIIMIIAILNMFKMILSKTASLERFYGATAIWTPVTGPPVL